MSRHCCSRSIFPVRDETRRVEKEKDAHLKVQQPKNTKGPLKLSFSNTGPYLQMESHLTALQATLASINGLHERQRQKRNYQPFTAAILNTHHLEVEDYIRDADQLENNLFWYPPAPGASSSTSSSSKDRLEEGQKQQQQQSEGDLLAPRLPEPREFVPPTPLKKQAKEAEAKGLVTFDARTLLKAAQKLLDN